VRSSGKLNNNSVDSGDRGPHIKPYWYDIVVEPLGKKIKYHKTARITYLPAAIYDSNHSYRGATVVAIAGWISGKLLKVFSLSAILRLTGSCTYYPKQYSSLL
jgi:hypothetical protein